MTLPAPLQTQFRDYIATRGGLYFRDHDLKNLEAVLEKRMVATKSESPWAYHHLLTASAKKEDELRELFNELTVNHTYFFRDEAQFAALKNKILPALLARKKTINIWSAGCSTGEEPYTIAMILKELLADEADRFPGPSGDVAGAIGDQRCAFSPSDVRFQILATDASTTILDLARVGVYSPFSMQKVPAAFKAKYFQEVQMGKTSCWKLSNDIKKMVTFAYFNLLDEGFPAGFDIIFCRNVMIYFDFETTVHVLERFHRSLEKEGHLFVGYAESLQFFSDKFELCSEGDGIFYQHPSSKQVLKASQVPACEEGDLQKLLEKMSHAIVAADKNAAPKKFEVSQKDIEELVVQAIRENQLKEFAKALGLLERALLLNDQLIEPYFLAAEILANQGQLDHARQKLAEVFRLDPFFAPAYALCGATYFWEQNCGEARTHLRKALYLDPQFSLAYFYMGMIDKTEGQNKQAIGAFRNVLRLLQNRPLTELIPWSGGLGVATLASVCRDNIERLKDETP